MWLEFACLWCHEKCKSSPMWADFWLTLAENLRTEDWLAEQGGLETPVSREVFVRENPREHWKNFAPKSASSVQRMSSPSVRFGGGRQP
jgi:hypothetical protein